MGFVEIIKLKDSYISLHDGSIIKLKHHPYYRALADKNRFLYRKYIKQSRVQSRKATADWYYFIRLKNKIFYDGFNTSKSPLVIRKHRGKYIFNHGRHRACILLHLYYSSRVKINFFERDKGTITAII
jgi:hypothetical protein